MIQTLTLSGYHPVSANTLLSTNPHWRSKIKQAEYDVIAGEAMQQGIAKASGKRRASYHMQGWPKGRMLDPSNALKVIEDALVAAGLLRDDSSAYYEIGRIEMVRSETWVTTITLEDIP